MRQYAGALLYLLGTALALGSYWGLLPFVSLIPFLIWRLIDERVSPGNLKDAHTSGEFALASYRESGESMHRLRGTLVARWGTGRVSAGRERHRKSQNFRQY